MRTIIRILLGLFLPLSLSAQYDLEAFKNFQNQKNYGFFNYTEIVLHGGSIMAHHDEMKDLTENPFYAVEFKLGWQTYGTREWEEIYKYPTHGIGFYISDFNSDAVGQPMALYYFMDFPLKRWNNGDLFNFEFGVGVSYNINSFDPIENPDNIAIGSPVNVYFNFNFEFTFPLNDRWALTPGLGVTHFSNSSTVQPNLGLNMIDLNMGVAYNFNPIKNFTKFQDPDYEPALKPEFVKEERDPIFRRWNWYIHGAGGVRQTGKTGDTFWGIGTADTEVNYQFSHVYRLGLGVDYLYDAGNIQHFIDDDGLLDPSYDPDKDNWYLGVHIGNELLIDRATILLHIGYYLRETIDISLPVYIRLGARYHIFDNIFLQASFKTHHIGQAQYIEWGLGIDLL